MSHGRPNANISVAYSSDDVIIDDTSLEDTDDGLRLSFYVRQGTRFSDRALVDRSVLEEILSQHKHDIQTEFGQQVSILGPLVRCRFAYLSSAKSIVFIPAFLVLRYIPTSNSTFLD